MDKKNSSVYVRARDGALYENPSFSFLEGFIAFHPDCAPKIVLWLPCELEPVDIVERILGPSDGWRLIGEPEVKQDQVVPNNESPPRRHPAAIFDLEISRRIPKPTLYDTVEKYLSRIRGATIIDPPADPRDIDSVPY